MLMVGTFARPGADSAAGATRSWTNGGSPASSLWSTPANWQGGLVPQKDDAVVFPPSGAPSHPDHDGVSGFQLASVTITGQGYILGGLGIALSQGINTTYANGSSTLNQNVTLRNDQTWTIGPAGANSSTFILAGNIALDGHTLRVVARAAVTLDSGVPAATTLGTIIIDGAQTVEVCPNNTWRAAVKVTDGALRFQAAQAQGGVEVSGGTLSGSGTVAALTVSGQGVVAPRIGPVATLVVTGDASFLGGTLRMAGLNLNQGAMDRLQVGGHLRAGGRLEFVFANGFTDPPGNTQFMVVDHRGSGPVEGEFENMPEGATVHNRNRLYRLTYRGGDGNDVVLTTLLGEVREYDAGAVINSENWTKDNNWDPDSAPSTGMNLVFPSFANDPFAPFNDFPTDTAFGLLRLAAANYTLTGNRVVLRHGVEAVEPNTIQTPMKIALAGLRLGTDVSFLAGDRARLTVDTPVLLDGHTATLRAAGTGVASFLDPISGAGNVITDGTGTVQLHAANSYTGGTTVRAGRLELHHASALGAPNSSTLVQTGATLAVAADAANGPISEVIELSGTLEKPSGLPSTVDLSNSLILQNGAVVRAIAGQLRFGGAVSGPGALSQIGGSELLLTGPAPNTFTGGTVVVDSTLVCQKTAGVTALPGPVRVGQRGLLRLAANEQIANSAIITLEQGEIDLRSSTERIGGLVMLDLGNIIASSNGVGRLTIDGPVTASTGGISVPVQVTHSGGGKDRLWTVSSNGLGLRVTGSVSSPDGTALRKTGPGSLSLVGNHEIPLIVASEGGVFLDGQSPLTALRLNDGHAKARGTLARVEDVGGGGLFSPEREPDTPHTAALVKTGHLVLLAGAALEFDLNGLIRGTLYDALDVTAAAPSLAGATLSLVRGFTPAVGASFLLIDNQTALPVNGTFAGLPEGSLIPVPGGPSLQLTYTGSTGNDVVLTAVVATTTAPPAITTFSLSRGTGPGGQDQVLLGGTAPAGSSMIIETNRSLSPSGWTLSKTVVVGASGQVVFAIDQTSGLPELYFRLRKL